MRNLTTVLHYVNLSSKQKDDALMSKVCIPSILEENLIQTFNSSLYNQAKFGVDILTFYELSWLNEFGKPQIACISILTPHDLLKKIETTSFKRYLNSFSMRNFVESKDIEVEIQKAVNKELSGYCKLLFVPSEKFHPINWKENQGLIESANYKIVCSSYNVRFVCKHTSQPFCGYVALYGDISSLLQDNLSSLLLKFRRQDFTLDEYAACLFEAMEQRNNKQEMIMSLHVARRGGFSFQYIRSNFFKENEKFMRRSLIE